MPIVNDDHLLVGIVTESDFVGKEVKVPHALASIKQLFGQKFYFGDIEKIYHDAKNKKLKDVMTKTVHTIAPDTSLDTIISMMMAKKLKRLPVIQDDKLVGIITRKNLIQAFSLVD